MNSTYAGIGSRYITETTAANMQSLGYLLAMLGVTLRSGAADGSDAAFEQGCDSLNGPKEIFLPWRRFKEHPSPLFTITDKAYKTAQKYYKFDNWYSCKDLTKRFLARDCQQVSGQNLDDFVDFVVCYTRDGCEHHDDRTRDTGGTGQAISYASLNNVPVFNLHNKDRFDDLAEFIRTHYYEPQQR